MAVVVQELIDADASGVLFTADPVTWDRTLTVIEAVRGLGDAFVSGRAQADTYRLRHDRIVERAGGGTEPVLADGLLVDLAQVGRRVESHLGRPQDVEWCVTGGRIHLVQTRPITTLFPIPVAGGDGNRAYVSVGHQQMMTDAMKPLGLSMWNLTTPAPMVEAGGRLFVDVTPRLASPGDRPGLLDVLGSSDPLLRDALETIVARPGFLPPPPPDEPDAPPRPALPGPRELLHADPAIVAELRDANRRSVDCLRRRIESASGTEVFDVIADDIRELRRLLFDPRSLHVITTAMDATAWLDTHLADWLGDDRPCGSIADSLTRSAPDNVTSEMGLALLDVADAIRPHAEVVSHLRHHGDDGSLLDGLDGLDGGPASRHAIERFIDRYGMRCVGEIDITRPRWVEQPAALVPTLLTNIDSFAPGEGRRRFDRGVQEARRTEREVLERLRALPDGDVKAAEATRMIDRVRTFIGYREYPKYGMVSRYLL